MDRALHRRPPSDIQSINQPFDPNTFNFTRIKNNEKLFGISHETEIDGSNFIFFNILTTSFNERIILIFFTPPLETNNHVIAVNVSPLEYGHVLLIPNIEKKLPQILTENALKLAVHIILLSNTSYVLPSVL